MNNDLISRSYLKEHKFTTQVCNGVEIESVDVVSVATIDNAPTIVSDEAVVLDFTNITEEQKQQLVNLLSKTRIKAINEDVIWQNGYDACLNDKSIRERPTGHWISANGTYYCSCCKHYAYESQKFDFCQDCGADMRGGSQ